MSAHDGTSAAADAGRPADGDERADLDDVLRTALGAGTRICDARVVRRARDYLVAIAIVDRPALRVVVKSAGPAAALACPFESTAATLRRVRDETDVPVPTVLAVGRRDGHGDRRFLVTSSLPGVPWSDVRAAVPDADLAPARADLGRALAALHGLRHRAYGEIGADGEVVDGDAYLPALVARARRRIAAAAQAERFVALLEERADAFASVDAPTLAHEDPNPTNLLLERREGRLRLSGVLDFDSAWAGGPEGDLARLALWDGMADPGFWRSYGASGPEALPSTRRLLHQLLWCLEFAAASDRHRADTARVCRALGVDPAPFLSRGEGAPAAGDPAGRDGRST